LRYPDLTALELRLQARPGHGSTVRQHVRHWLAEVGATDRQVFEITLAVMEAFSNAVKHPRERSSLIVTVDGQIQDGTVTVKVSDTGSGQRGDSADGGGRGIPLMKVLMDTVKVEYATTGATVTMSRRLRGPRAPRC
jgi:anti-sigma regulatory factor (Ser/Thr protein kinase)